MCKIFRKFLSALGYVGFFSGYFYILFINLEYSLSVSGIETRWDALKILLLSFVISVGLPGIISTQTTRSINWKKKLKNYICKE